MAEYKIVFTTLADNDINNLYDVITNQYKAPLTAKRYLRGIIVYCFIFTFLKKIFFVED